MQVPSHLDPTKMIDQYNHWAVTIVNSKKQESKFSSPTEKPLEWVKKRASDLVGLPKVLAGHAAIIIETIDLDGDYSAYFADLCRKTIKGIDVSKVRIMNTSFGKRRLTLEDIETFNHPNKKGETYLCEADKVNRLIQAIEEEQKICQDAAEGIKNGLSKKVLNARLDYPQFSAVGRYSLFLVTKPIKIGDDYPSKEEVIAAVDKLFGDLPMIRSKLSIKCKDGVYTIIKKPDNCLTWAQKMVTYYCEIRLKRGYHCSLFAAPTAQTDDAKRKALENLSMVPEIVKFTGELIKYLVKGTNLYDKEEDIAVVERGYLPE